MTSIRCDACRKDIRDARKDVNYFAILGKDFCGSCYEKVRDNAGRTWTARKPMSFGDYQTLLAKTVQKMTAG